MKIPVNNGKHLKYNLVGTHLDNYDSILNLAHGKGLAMGGFGANLKNNLLVSRPEMAKRTSILLDLRLIQIWRGLIFQNNRRL